MTDPTKTSWNYVWVKDRAGNEFVCQVDALKKADDVPDKELEGCLDDASRAIPVGD